MNNGEFAVIPAIKVSQPLGDFFAVALNADVLRQVAYSIPAVAIRDDNSATSYQLDGTQRVLKQTRLKEIGQFIETVEATFPNSIILGANYDEESGTLVDDERRWYVTHEKKGFYYLHIPTNEKLASIIDGQHRLKGFEFSQKNKDMPLLCAVFLDLPFPYHAYVFATINYNQKSVSKSLAYELFGFDLNDKASEAWAPEMLAVYLTRIFANEKNSPLHGHVRIGVIDEESLEKEEGVWTVSLATIVDGIMSLISSNPKRDRDVMHMMPLHDGRSRSLLKPQPGRPLRKLYLQNNDAAIYTILKNYFTTVEDLMWKKATKGSYITKTVGLQALFDVLRLILNDLDEITRENTSIDFFREKLERAAKIDFCGPYFEASNIGKGLIKHLIAISCGLQSLDDVRGVGNRNKIIEILHSQGIDSVHV